MFSGYHTSPPRSASQMPTLPQKHPGQEALETGKGWGRLGKGGQGPKSLETWKQPASVLHRVAGVCWVGGGKPESKAT